MQAVQRPKLATLVSLGNSSCKESIDEPFSLTFAESYYAVLILGLWTMGAKWHVQWEHLRGW